MICPYSFDEPVGSGIPALLDGRYWCMGHIALGMSARRRRCPEDCPVCLGEWGAWRAVGREVSWRAEVISEMAQEYDTDRLNLGALFVSLAMYIEIRIYLEAVGWSP